MSISKLDIFTHFDLQGLNTLAVPSVAGNYVKVSNEEDVKQSLSLANELELPVLVLGGGSNIILPEMFAGLVVHVDIKGIEVVSEDEKFVWLKVGAGEVWHQLVEHCLNFHYWGIENLALIPGTVGAAPIQNIGAYGVELESVFEELTAIERQSQVAVTFKADGCQFAYRDSIFKNRFKHQYIITSVTLRLSKTPSNKVTYPALQEAIKQAGIKQLSPTKIADLVCQIRRSKLPDPTDIPNVGSFFKNPIVDSEKFKHLKEQFPDIVSYPLKGKEDQFKLAAAWLIDQAGWKGVQELGVGVHNKQALVLINPGKRAATHIIALAEKIRESVDAKFGVSLQVEPDSYL